MNQDRIPFSLANPWKFPLHGLPLRASIPFPEGTVRDPAAEWALVDEQGADLGAQWRVLSRWKDESVRFALLDYAEAHLPPTTTRHYQLGPRPADAPPRDPPSPIRVQEGPDTVTVDTGRLAWTFSTQRFSLAESVVFAGRDWVAGAPSDLTVVDAGGQVYRASEGEMSVELEENGPFRVIVLVRGTYRNPLRTFMSYWIRFHFTAGGAQVLMTHHLRNREPGREGRDIRRSTLSGGLTISTGATHRLVHEARTVNTSVAVIEVPENVDLDVGPYQTALRNETSLREDPDDICYSLKQRLQPGDNRRCSALLDIHEPEAGGLLMKFTAPNPSYEAPLRLAADQGRFEIDFFPETGEPIHLGEGMGKTRDVLFHVHDDSWAPMDLIHASHNLAYPGVKGVPHEVYRQSKFADVDLTLVRQPNKYPLLETKINYMKCPGDIQNKQAIKSKPLLSATYGWRDFGDYVGLRGRMPELGVRQYMNNEEDYLYCAMLDAWRTGRPFDGLPSARHLMDIDFIDYSEDPGRNGATCPHSANHTDGEVYPSHQWCQGLLYFYLGTGDEEALRIAKRVGDCLCWWLTGPRHRSTRASGRESAWPLLSLAALYDVTGETKYRDAGMIVIDDMIRIIEERGEMVWEHPTGSGIFDGYMIAMTFNGVWDMYAATGEQKVLELWKTLTMPIVDALSDPNSMGYVHFRNAHLIWPDLTVLARWHYLTGDSRYIELGKIGLRLVLAACPQPLIQTASIFAMGYRHFILFLKLADEHGLINDDLVTLVW